MSNTIGRRELLVMAGTAVARSALGAEPAGPVQPAKKIVGISCSPRKGKTTAEAVTISLDAAKEHVPGLEVEFIDLADLNIPAYIAAGLPLREGEKDDFPALQSKLEDPKIVGVIIGSPVHFGNMSALCKAFLDRCMALRANDFKWRNKFAGVVAVGGSRNGGQELTIQSIRTALSGQDMITVGTGQPSVRIGATLWNQDNSITADEIGIGAAKDLGRNVAELAVKG